jgi:hypothetical protein
VSGQFLAGRRDQHDVASVGALVAAAVVPVLALGLTWTEAREQWPLLGACAALAVAAEAGFQLIKKRSRLSEKQTQSTDEALRAQHRHDGQTSGPLADEARDEFRPPSLPADPDPTSPLILRSPGVPRPSVSGTLARNVRASADVLWSAKVGGRDEDYEDAFATSPEHGRFAVADGASSSFEAGAFAQALVDHYVRFDVPTGPHGIDRWIASALGRHRLLAEQTADADERHADASSSDDADWWLGEATSRGAFATFLGVSIGMDGTWRALSIGDSCLTHLRPAAAGGGYDRIRSFPLSASYDFGSTPGLVASNIDLLDGAVSAAQTASGRCDPGDVLCLSTDAITMWALQNEEAGVNVWAHLVTSSQKRFAEHAELARRRGEMENDDLTVLRIRM